MKKAETNVNQNAKKTHSFGCPFKRVEAYVFRKHMGVSGSKRFKSAADIWTEWSRREFLS